MGYTPNPIPIPMTGGVNLLSDPLRIRDDQCVKLKNLYPNTQGKVALRKGPEQVRTAGAATGRKPSTFWVPRAIPDECIFVDRDTGADETYLNANGADLLIAVDSGTYRCAMVEFNRNLIVSSGSPFDSPNESLAEVVMFDTTLALQAAPIKFTNSDGDVLTPKVLGIYQGRMVYANFGPGFEDCIVFSDPGRPYKINSLASGDEALMDLGNPSGDTFSATTDAKMLRLSQLAGDAIVAVQEVSSGNLERPDESALLVLGKETAIVSPGSTLGTEETGDPIGTFSPRAYNYSCGCVSAETVVRTPVGVLWAGWNDVWAMGPGGAPVRVGTNIRPALIDCPAETRFLWHAAYDHDTGSYRLAITSNEQTFPLSSKIVYACRDQWWLDLRGGLPQTPDQASWYGPQQYRMMDAPDTNPQVPGTLMMRTQSAQGEDDTVYALHLAHAGGVADVPVLVAMDLLEGRDRACEVATSGGDHFPSTQQNNDITFEIITKKYDLGDPMVEKQFLGLEMSIFNSDVLGLDLEIIGDGGITRNIVSANLDLIGEVDEDVDPDVNSETHPYQAVTIWPDETTAPRGKILQFKLTSKCGYAVGEESIMSQILLGPEVGDAVEGTIATGFYATLSEFLDALYVAMNATGLVFDAQELGAFADQYDANVIQIVSVNASGPEPVWNWFISVTLVPLSGQIARRSNKVAKVLGITDNGGVTNTSDVASTGAIPFGQFIEGVVNVADGLTPQVELGGLILKLYSDGRRPSGTKYEPTTE